MTELTSRCVGCSSDDVVPGAPLCLTCLGDVIDRSNEAQGRAQEPDLGWKGRVAVIALTLYVVAALVLLAVGAGVLTVYLVRR